MIRRFLDSWTLSESEPTWPQVIVAGVLFAGFLFVFPALIVMVAVGMDLL